MIDDTDPELKKNISWLAYFVSGVKNLFAPKYKGDVTITSADGSTHTTHGLTFRTFMAGNCGQIPVFSLMPDAVYDDGILDYEIIDTSDHHQNAIECKSFASGNRLSYLACRTSDFLCGGIA